MIAVVWLLGALAAGPPNCGVAATAAYREALAMPGDPALAARLQADFPAADVSLAEVRDMAQRAGLELTGFQATPAELAEAGRPAIVHLRNPEHFACLVGLDAEWGQLLDGWPARPRLVPRAWFDEHYSGACLLGPDPPEGGPRLAIERRHAAYPRGTVGAEIEHGFGVSNRGVEPLDLRLRASSCSCTAAAGDSWTVPPGGSVEIAVRLRPKLGTNLIEHVMVATNDPRVPLLYLSIGVAEVPQNLIVRPDELLLAAKPGESAAAALTVVGPPGLGLRAARDDALTETHLAALERGDTQTVYRLTVEAPGGPACGEHRGTIILDLDSEGPLEVRVPFRLFVADAVNVNPRRVFRGNLPPGGYQLDVAIRSLDRPVAVTAATLTGLPLLRLDEREQPTPGCWRLVVRGVLPVGTHRGELTVDLDHPLQPKLTVPITLVVRDEPR